MLLSQTIHSGAGGSSSMPGSGPARLALFAKLGLAAWAGFWTWFAASVAVSEGLKSVFPAACVILPTCTIAVLAWRRPTAAGVSALVAAAIAAAVFRGPDAWMLMAAPPALLGVLLLVGARRRGA